MTRQIQKIGILRMLVIILLLGISVGWGFLSGAAADTAPNDLMAKGHRWYEQGNLEQAAESWSQASADFQKFGDHPNHIQALIYTSRALTEMGKNQRAQLLLQTAVQTAQTHNQAQLMAQALDQLGALHLNVGEAEHALPILQEGLKISRNIQDRPLVATILNDLGNTHAFLNNYTAAIAAYTESSILADSLDLHALSIRAMVNVGLVEMKTDAIPNATIRLQQAWEKTRNLPDSHEKVQNFLTIGRGLRDISRQDTENHDSLFIKCTKRKGGIVKPSNSLNWPSGPINKVRLQKPSTCGNGKPDSTSDNSGN
jgi:tetratricopeptide (TPR) repeat protein